MVAKRGTIPSATKIDAIRTKIIVNGIEEINCPVTPDKKKRAPHQ
jgi:hypothetical protein